MNIDDAPVEVVLLRGEWYVVISRPALLCKCILRKDIDYGYMAEYQYITAKTEVEMVFPGCVYVLPDYIQ